MLTFLRKVRRSLIDSGATRKYLLYAIGEIALVVIGILIALQVNNWNESRKTKLEVDVMKKNLRDEFLENRKDLNDRIALLNQSIQHSNTIMNFMGNPPRDLSEPEIDSILVRTQYYGNFNPSNSSIQELVQSGGLKLLLDDTLKIQLFEWLETLEDTDEDFKNQDLHAQQYLTPFINKHISLRNADLMGFWRVTDTRSSLLVDYYDELFRNYEFENLMVYQLIWHTIMIEHYQDLDNMAEAILARLKKSS